MGRNILSICDECKVYLFHLRGKESDYMQKFQQNHSMHERKTRIVSDYVIEAPEAYEDVTDTYTPSETPTNSPQDGLREQILKAGNVSASMVSISQKIFDNDLATPITFTTQNIVEIGIDDLMQLIEAQATKRERQALESIGEPTLRHVGQMKADQYEGGLIIDKWYKDRIAHLLSELDPIQQDDEDVK